MRQLALPALLAVLSCCVVTADAAPADRVSPLELWLADIAQQAAACIGPYGLLGRPREVGQLPPRQEWTGSVELQHAHSTLVSDGYVYTLVVHGPGNAGYLIQSGGLGGGQRFFGPFNLARICRSRFLE